MRNANSKSLCGGTRREVFKLTLHGTPYNVLENSDHINLVQGMPGYVYGTPINVL